MGCTKYRSITMLGYENNSNREARVKFGNIWSLAARAVRHEDLEC